MSIHLHANKCYKLMHSVYMCMYKTVYNQLCGRNTGTHLKCPLCCWIVPSLNLSS